MYRFYASTADRDRFEGTSSLSHELPATVSILHPREGAPMAGLKITWSKVVGLAAHIVEIEQDELGVNVTATLPGAATSFAVPDGFLRAGTEYRLSLGTVSDEGNISFVETTFTTDSGPAGRPPD